ncbi:MAG: hypothetical protein RL748_4179 [Pseudomonadota bacterium]|jgi:hypothetical protein
MSLPSISANRTASAPPFAGLDIGKSIAKALANGNSISDGASGNRFGVKNRSDAASADLVQLSGQGQALQALDASGQDGQAEAEILSKLTRQSLTYLVPDAQSAKISFDSLSFSSSSSTSFSQISNGNGVASVFHSEQKGSLVGHGLITTADGREFEFDAELDISSSTDISQVIQGGTNPASAGQLPVAAANGNTGFTGIGVGPNARLPGPPGAGSAARSLDLQDFIAASDRLLDLLQQTNPGNAGSGSSGSSSASNTIQSANPAEQLVKDLLAQLQKPGSADANSANATTVNAATANGDNANTPASSNRNAAGTNATRAIQSYQ